MASEPLRSLLKAVAVGDETAFRALYEATSGKLFGVAIRILKRNDLAEEVVQDTYLRIWDGAVGYRPAAGTPLAWMVTITRNRAIDVLRKRSEDRLDEDAGDSIPDENAPDPFAATERSRELRALLSCLKKLNDDYRRSLLMAYYYGYTHEEIAARLPAPLGTVKSRIRRGLAQIKECLGNG